MIVKGLVGDQVTITCTHSNARGNRKYLCKAKCLEKDVLIRSRKKKGSDRYSIKDQGNTFFTTIKHLRLDDAGTYWCGIDRIGLDTYVEVYLEVNDGERIPFLSILCITGNYRLLFFVAFFWFDSSTYLLYQRVAVRH